MPHAWLWTVACFFVRRAIRNGYWTVIGRPEPGTNFRPPQPFVAFLIRPNWALDMQFPNLVQERFRRLLFDIPF